MTKLVSVSATPALLLLLLLCATLRWSEAQFLFTYEINQESDDSRAPKSSLFDPSSFRIVTPSQLQSSYQKLSSGSVPLSSPLPTQASVETAPTGNGIDQQAEARSLHEHWTQQQQKSHHQQTAALLQHQHEPAPASQQQQSLANAALNSFTTSQPTGSQQQQQQQSAQQASYWLTANPLPAPDGNYLVQIKQQQQQHRPEGHLQSQVQVTSPASLVENLLTVGQPRPTAHQLHQQNHHHHQPQQQQQHHHHHHHQQQQHHQQPQQQTANLAQASFLATPTSYYPAPAAESSTARVPVHVSPPAPVVTGNELSQSRQVSSFSHSTPLSTSLGGSDGTEAVGSHQLQPPANLPDNFPPQQVHHHKSAEESLISFRKQQQQQHDQQSALFEAQQQLAAAAQTPRTPSHFIASAEPAQPRAPQVQVPQQQQQQHQQVQRQTMTQQQQPAAQHASPLGEIPKVSPQIYESFLLQQRDQHEKHMELLKQQQEINKLMEQKQKQQEAESKRKRKKEELDKQEARKRAREAENARKLRQEQEERRKREEEETQRKRQVEEQQRRYREFQERERRERELKLQRQAEEEAREAKVREQERLEREQAELVERRRAAADLANRKRREKEAEEAKQMNLLRQQEELRKLLELKQKEDEAQQQRRRQAAQQQQQPQQQQQQQQQQPQQQVHRGNTHSQSGRANRLAQEHRERSSAASWGAPIRSLRLQSTISEPVGDLRSSPMQSTTTTSTSTTTSTTQSPASSSSTTMRSEQPEVGSRLSSTRARLVKKQRLSGNLDEKLIRQKIPLYSGAGKYGLYRGSNDSFSSDLAALLDSVTLPVSSTTASSSSATTSTSTTTMAPSSTPNDESPSSSATPSSRSSVQSDAFSAVTASWASDMSSLSPLLARSGPVTPSPPSDTPAEPFFDDDVPRRPARGLGNRQQPASQRAQQLATASSSRQQTRPLNETIPSGQRANIGLASLPPDSDNDGIPGRAGIEYPVLSAVPPTSFSCSKQPLNGYYADTETACQVVHLCQSGVQSSILCPNGTIFNQEKFSCQWWYEVNCSRAPIFYQLNDNLYKSLPAGSSAPTGASSGPADPSSPDSSLAKRKSRKPEAGKPIGANLLSSGAAAA